MSSFPKLVIAITLLLSSACTLTPYTIKYNKVGNSNYYYMPENGLYIRLLDFDCSNALMIIGRDSISLANVKVTNDSPADLPDSINYFFDKGVKSNAHGYDVHFSFAVDSSGNFFVKKEQEMSSECMEHFPSFKYTRYEGIGCYDNFYSNFAYRSNEGTMCVKDGWALFWIKPIDWITKGYELCVHENGAGPKTLRPIGSDFEKKKRK